MNNWNYDFCYKAYRRKKSFLYDFLNSKTKKKFKGVLPAKETKTVNLLVTNCTKLTISPKEKGKERRK